MPLARIDRLRAFLKPNRSGVNWKKVEVVWVVVTRIEPLKRSTMPQPQDN